jgi:hypothetical protein
MGTWAGYSGNGDPETVRTLLGLGSRIESGEGWGVGISYASGGEVPLLIATTLSCTAQIGNPLWQGCAVGFSDARDSNSSDNNAESETQFRADATGFCPIYTTQTDQRQWFASDPRLLVPLPYTQPQVDQYALHLYLQNGVVPPPQTIFRGVGCLNTTTQATPSRRRTLALRAPKTLAEHVQRCAPASKATAVGVFFDGSLEGALIAVLLMEAGHSVILFAPDDPNHPVIYLLAEVLAEHLRVPLRRVIFDTTEAANAFVPTVLALAQPCSDVRLPLYYLLAERCREHVSEMWLGLSAPTLPLQRPDALTPFLSDLYAPPMRLLLENAAPATTAKPPTIASTLPALFDQHNVRVRVPFAELSLTTEAHQSEIQTKVQALLPDYWANPDMQIRWDFPLEPLTHTRHPVRRVFDELLTPRILKHEDRFTPHASELLAQDPAALWTLATWEAFRQGLGLR